MSAFDEWYDKIGAEINPSPGDDMQSHAEYVACLAYKAGMLAAAEILEGIADDAYCRGIQMASSFPECLGWEAKAKNGEFGKPEMNAHEKMNRYFGVHYGGHSAAKEIRKAAEETTE